MSAATPVRVGVVGLGGIAQTAHLPLLRRRWDLFDLVAVADLSAERRDAVGRAYGVAPAARFASLAQLCGSGLVDAVLLLTPGNHAPEVVEILGFGLPVLCEKPVGLTRADVEAVVAAEGAAGTPRVLVGYMKEYDPAVIGARAALADAGEIRMVDVEVLHPADGAQLAFATLRPAPTDVPAATFATLAAQQEATIDQAVGRDGDPMLRALYPQVVLGSIVHDISLLRHLVGPVREVDSARHWPGGVLPGSVELTGTLDSGGPGPGTPFHLGWHFLPDYPEYRERVTVHHATGSVEIVFAVPYVTDAPTELIVTTMDRGGTRRSVTRTVAEAFEAELAAFHAMVTAGQRPSSGPREGLADIVVAQRIAAALAHAHGWTLGGEAAGGGRTP